MPNLKTVTVSFTGYKTLAELTGLTLEADKTYMIQVLSNSSYYARKGTEGTGFEDWEHRPFPWTYDGVNDLYIGNKYASSLTINVDG